ncbi:MAG: amidohydrolase family protein [Acidithiobacillales bacterium]
MTAEGVRQAPLLVAEGRVVDAFPPGTPFFTLRLLEHLVFPGLVNAHDHLTLNAIPPPARTRIFPNSYEWIGAFQAHFSDPAVIAARSLPERVRAFHGGLKNILAGTTTVAHHDPWSPDFDDPAFPVEVLRRYGWSHSLGLEEDYGPPVASGYEATPKDMPWFIHLAEGTDSRAAAELERLDELGAFGENTLLVHGVGLTADGMERVLSRGAGVVWCPASNLAVLGATLDPRRPADARRLALGTDSRLSGSPDLLAELRVAAASSDLAPSELLRLATVDAARLLRLPDRAGLRPGKRADFIVLRDPGGAPAAALLRASRADLRAIVRDGLPAVTDPDLAGWFDAAGIPVVPIRLDGRPKFCAARFLRLREAADLEPGLEIP